MKKITIVEIREYQKRMEIVKKNGFKAIEFKELGRELRDEFNLTDRDAVNILTNQHEEILKILD